MVYEYLRQHVFVRDANGQFPLWKSCISAITAGATAQFITNPCDLIKVQMIMDNKNPLFGKPKRFTGATNAVIVIFKHSGVRGLWKGVVPNMGRAALVTVGDITAYDVTKGYLLKLTNMKDNIWAHMICSTAAGLTSSIIATPVDTIKTRMMNQPTDELGR